MSTVESEGSEGIYTIIGAGSAVMQFAALTAVGVFALESATYGAIAGVFVGAGSYLFMPWFLQLSAAQNESDDQEPLSEITDRIDGDPQTKIFGLGLELGGIVMFAAGFATEEPNFLIGVPAAIAVTLAVFLVGSILFDR